MGKRLIRPSLLALLFLALLRPFPAAAAESASWEISSPDGRITAKVRLDEEGKLYYSVSLAEENVIGETQLGLALSDIDFSNGRLAFESEERRDIRESYSLPGGGIKSVYRNNANELTLHFTKKSRPFALQIRVFDDGAAYRYSVDGDGTASIDKETSGFRLPEGAVGWAAKWTVSYENPPLLRSYEDLCNQSDRFLMPLTVQTPEGTYLSFCESGVDKNYCASHMTGGSDGTLSISWAPDQKGAVKAAYPVRTPWRAAIIAEDLNGLVNSTLVDNLSPAQEMADASWIGGGRAAWDWVARLAPGYDNAVQLVDFAAEMGWEYVLLDEGWDESYIPDVIQYADEKGVGVWLWSHYKKLDSEEEVERSLNTWADWGVKGVKVDFFESDSQSMMKNYERITEKAAELKLMLNYHGCTKPVGWERRWPHVLTMESVPGNEYYLWSEGNSAQVTCTLPFTRGLCGPADYTPVMYSRNRGRTTWAHQTAFAMIQYSPLIHCCDDFAIYRNLITRDFLSRLPSGFDETRILEGEIGSYITMARRNGGSWYVGAICDEARTAEIPLDFLGGGAYTAWIYQDGDCDEDIRFSQTAVTAQSTLLLPLRAHGGCVVCILPAFEAGLSPAYGQLDGAGWTADASDKGQDASLALDGDASTYWEARGGQWYAVDLGKTASFNRIKLDAGADSPTAYPRQFAIYASSDGENWGEPLASGKGCGRITDLLFDEVSARYVKVESTGKDAARWRIASFEVYGKQQK